MSQDAEMLKQFKSRLQFLGRYNQVANKRANEVYAKLPKNNQLVGENRDKFMVVKVRHGFKHTSPW